MRKLLLVNPVGTSRWNLSAELYLKPFIKKGFSLSVCNLSKGPENVETEEDHIQICYYLQDEVPRLAKGYDAIIVNSVLESGILSLRERVSIPVIGALEAALLKSTLYRGSFAIICTCRNEKLVRLRVRELGFDRAFKGVRCFAHEAYEYSDPIDRERMFEALLSDSREALSEGADILLMCGFPIAHFADRISLKLGAPVIEFAKAALELSMALLQLDAFGRLEMN